MGWEHTRRESNSTEYSGQYQMYLRHFSCRRRYGCSRVELPPATLNLGMHLPHHAQFHKLYFRSAHSRCKLVDKRNPVDLRWSRAANLPARAITPWSPYLPFSNPVFKPSRVLNLHHVIPNLHRVRPSLQNF
jgi:hypothetical protein